MRTLTLAAALVLTLSACTSTGGGGGTDPTLDAGPTSSTGSGNGGSQPFGQTPSLVAASLQVANDCDDLLDYFIKQALEQVGPWGLQGGGFAFRDFGFAEEAAADTASQGGGDGSPTIGHQRAGRRRRRSRHRQGRR